MFIDRHDPRPMGHLTPARATWPAFVFKVAAFGRWWQGRGGQGKFEFWRLRG